MNVCIGILLTSQGLARVMDPYLVHVKISDGLSTCKRRKSPSSSHVTASNVMRAPDFLP